MPNHTEPSPQKILGTRGLNAKAGDWLLLRLGLSIGLSLILGLLCRWLSDDAFISFTYSRHLAEGHGLVFNIGQVPPIEGYTNLAWVLVLGAFEWLGIAAPSIANLLSVFALGWLLFSFSGDLLRVGKRSHFGIAMPVLLLATMPPIVVWGTGSLESMWFALGVYQVARRLIALEAPTKGLAVWVLLTVTLRTDGFVFLGALLGTVWVQSMLGAKWSDRALILRTAAFVAGSLALTFLFRWLVHGTLLPHTAVVKVDPSPVVFGRGLRYLGAMLLGMPSLGLLFLCLAWSLARASHLRDKRLALCMVPLTCLGLSTIVGGDFMAYGRFLLPGIAPAFLALALHNQSGHGLHKREPCSAFPTALLAGSALAFSSWHFLPKPIENLVHFRWNDDEYKTESFVWAEMKQRAFEWSHLGKALGQHTKPGEVIVRGAIGAMGYYSELFFLDTYGLVCDEVAWGESSPSNHSPGHDKQVPDAYFLPRNPDYFTYTALVSSSEPYAGIPEPFFADPLISSNFTIELIELEDNPGTSLRLVRYTPVIFVE